MSKLYFYDTGLCARLQSHSDENTLWNSAQICALFESLVFAEIIKTKDNFLMDWNLFVWRTKDQNEIDFILQKKNKTIFIEAKLAIHGARPFVLDREIKKVFSPPFHNLIVTAGGETTS